jgi:transcriptional regulator with GAF, ATPase, and Fis domain
VRSNDLKRMERESIVAALDRTNRKISGAGGAAELLGINPSTLFSRMRSLGINRKDEIESPRASFADVYSQGRAEACI